MIRSVIAASCFLCVTPTPASVDYLQPGEMDRLRQTYAPCTNVASVGKAWGGRLRCGQLVPEHPGLLAMTRLAYGTAETMTVLDSVGDRWRAKYPSAAPVEILDVSLPAGGPHPAHISHQTGRDIDVSYVYVSDVYNGGYRPADAYRMIPIEHIDADRTWALLDAFLKTRRVHLVLINHTLQPRLYQAAENAGVGKRRLKKVFQYPRGPKVRAGIIRHYAGHLEHFHVRLKCPRGDALCR